VVWRSDPFHHDGNAGTDVFDLSCTNAQRLFSTVRHKEAHKKQPLTLVSLLSALPIAAVTLPRLDLRLRMLLPVARQGTSNIIDFFELALLVSSHESFIFAGINQLAMTLRCLLRHVRSSLNSVGFLYSVTR